MSAPLSFLGSWFTTFGPMTLEPDGQRLAGRYRFGTSLGELTGGVEDGELRFAYRDGADSGTGAFRLLRSGYFQGRYQAEGSSHPRRWDGERGFDGVWTTTFGFMRLVERDGRVRGVYGDHAEATLEGTLDGDAIRSRYREGESEGEAVFRLDESQLGFTGQWRPAGDPAAEWKPWIGRRVPVDTGTTWLVVLEAHWQRDLAEPEYSFGNMLREVFARRAGVRVRHRYFHDTASLEAWCKQLVFLTEGAVVVIASHGTPQGLTIRGQLIDTDKVLGCMEHAQAVRLLHFSSCLVAQEGETALAGRAFPVSGYSTSVDWGASAMLEFTYLDMIINRGWDPSDAADALPRLVTYAGETAPPGSPYPPAGFRFFPGR